MQRKEPWDSSDYKANELTLSLFGLTEEVLEMTKMPKQVNNYLEAKVILKSQIGKSLISKGGLVAFISKNSAKEILSGKAVENSFEKHAHLLAVVNIDRLFVNAIEPWLFNLKPEKANDSLDSVRRLYSIMNYEERLVIVKITVKVFKNPKDRNRIYSIKVLDVL